MSLAVWGAEFAIVLVGAGEAEAAEKAVWPETADELTAHKANRSPAGRVDCRPSADPAEEPEAALATSDLDASSSDDIGQQLIFTAPFDLSGSIFVF